ncbi:hypothetical protein QUA03_27655 [Microcoleus sp. S36b_A4]
MSRIGSAASGFGEWSIDNPQLFQIFLDQKKAPAVKQESFSTRQSNQK